MTKRTGFIRPPLEDRFWAKVDKSGDCWLWTAYKNSKGYGQISVGGKMMKAHRVAYELAYGTITIGFQIDHTCHTRACVNPEHLRPVTNKQNHENRAGAQANSKSGVRGVYWHAATQKWQAQVGHNGQDFYLGLFATVDEAGAASAAKRLQLFTHNDMDHMEPPVTTVRVVGCGIRAGQSEPHPARSATQPAHIPQVLRPDSAVSRQGS